MRQFLNILVSIILISSCSEVRFSAPQPLNGKVLDEFPKAFIGNYVGLNGDTLSVARQCFNLADDECKNLKNERVVLKQKGKLLVLSCREILMAGEQLERKGWEVFPFEMKEDTLLVYFIDTSNEKKDETLKLISEIVPVENVLNEAGELEYFYIDPSICQFERLYSTQCFSVVEKFVRID